MEGWITFCFGGIIGFCLGIVSMIWLAAIGESEMCTEHLKAGEE
jgi:hypothetical protein